MRRNFQLTFALLPVIILMLASGCQNSEQVANDLTPQDNSTVDNTTDSEFPETEVPDLDEAPEAMTNAMAAFKNSGMVRVPSTEEEDDSQDVIASEENQDGEQDNEPDSLDDYSEDGYIDDPVTRDSVLPKIDESWIKFSETDEIWLDPKNKQVILGGRVCLRRGPLEMFACPSEMKEHESVVAVNCSAFMVHGALLAVGAESGAPVKYGEWFYWFGFVPNYVPVSGSKVEIDVTWLKDGKPETMDAQQWVQNAETSKALETHWVFGGSISERDPNSGQMLYGGDSGMLICVSNFTIATLDIPIESSDLEGNWMYIAFTKNIPQRGTRVLLTLKPEISTSKTEEETDMELQNFKHNREDAIDEKNKDDENDKQNY